METSHAFIRLIRFCWSCSGLTSAAVAFAHAEVMFESRVREKYGRRPDWQSCAAAEGEVALVDASAKAKRERSPKREMASVMRGPVIVLLGFCEPGTGGHSRPPLLFGVQLTRSVILSLSRCKLVFQN